jgi:hypothetical protein
MVWPWMRGGTAMFNWKFIRSKNVVEEVKHAVEEVKHAVEGVKPGGQELKPGVQEELPVVQAVTPIAQDVLAAVQDVPPAVENVLAVVQDAVPVVQEVLAAVQDVSPAAENVLAAVQDAVPVIQNAGSAVQNVLPVVQGVKFVIPEGATLEQILKEMLGLMAAENVNLHRMGQLYNYVVEKQLAQQAGFTDAPTYFRKKLANLSPATLNTYGAVAKSFTEEVTVQFGVTCLYLLLIYKEAAAVTVNHDEPGGTVIEVPGKDGQVTAKLFSACSVADMRKALQLKRKPASSKPVPAEDVAQAEEYRKALEGQFPTGSAVKVAVRNEKGNTVYDFTSVPKGHVGTMILSLMDHVPEGGEPQRTE